MKKVVNADRIRKGNLTVKGVLFPKIAVDNLMRYATIPELSK